MSVYRSETYDNGKTFAKLHRIIEFGEGALPHILHHSSGRLTAVCGHRNDPMGIRAMVSCNNGENRSDGLTVCNTLKRNVDLGYPSSVELEYGSILKKFYACRGTEKSKPYVHMNGFIPSEIMQLSED